MATIVGQSNEASEALRWPPLISGALRHAWRRGALSEPTLAPSALIANAERAERGSLQAGPWRDALEILTAELRQRDALNPLGKAMAHGQLVKLLRHRLRAERLWAKSPAIASIAVDRPVIILGQMRSGTTRLHRMLASDERFAFTRKHESLSPLARSPLAAVLSSAAVSAFVDLCNPDLRHIHPGAPWDAEEEFGLHALSLHGAMIEAQWHVPDFARWSEERDLAPVYVEFRKLVQTLRWRRGIPPDRLQLMKAPQFMQDLNSVLAVFPDARILWMDRDSETATASAASLVWNQQRIQADAPDPKAIATEWCRKVALRQERAVAALDRNPHVPVLRLDYIAMNRDWKAEVEKIYRFLDLELTPRTLRRMNRVVRAKSHRGHHYSAEQFGLSASSGA